MTMLCVLTCSHRIGETIVKQQGGLKLGSQLNKVSK